MKRSPVMKQPWRWAMLLLAILVSRSMATAPIAASGPAGYSASALYNLANSYARANRAGLAVLNYERARLLAPDDADIEANLEFVQRSAHVTAVASSSTLRRAATRFGPTTLAWTGVLGLALAGCGGIAAGLYPRRRWLLRALAVLALLPAGAVLANALVLWPILHSAVVITPTAPVRVSPVPMGEPAFALPEAERVSIVARHDNYLLIRTASGRSGWASMSEVVPVDPAWGESAGR